MGDDLKCAIVYHFFFHSETDHSIKGSTWERSLHGGVLGMRPPKYGYKSA